MSIGANISVVTAGAILAFAVRLRTEAVSVTAVGAVLMAVGAVGLILQIRALARQRELTTVEAQAPPEGVLVRPYGSPRPPYGPANTTQAPLAPGDGPYRYPDEYTGNEW
jgi:hypothetical protein